VLHLAAEEHLTKALLDAKVTAIAYETVQLPSRALPLLAPMSEVAGRLSVIVGANAMLRPNGGPGLLVSGVPGTHAANIVVLGGGVAGTSAVAMAVGLGANVTVLDTNIQRLRELDALYAGRVQTLASNAYEIEKASVNADMVIGSVLIPRDAPGFRQGTPARFVNGDEWVQTYLDNIYIGPENVLLKEGGFKKLLTAFNTQRCLNPSISLGLAEGAFEEAIRFVRERQIRGQAIAAFQGIQWKLAEMYRDIEAGRSLLYRACLSANPFPNPHEAAIAKMFVNEMAIRVANEALQMHGGLGFTDDAAVSRIYRGVRYGTLGGGATEALKDLVGKKLVDDFDPVDGFLSMGTF
jgi:hypothetical protein